MGMLNYETLLSSYDDKLTLMQWLKKVEAALKNASATSFVLNKKGNATISFSIVFEDGTSLESGDIVLQQGESVQSAYIQNGHLHLVLTNGDDLDAGALLEGNPLTIPAVNVDFVGNVLIEGALSVDGPAVIDGTTKLNVISSDEAQISAEKPVVEVMTGYGVQRISSTLGDAITPLYVGISKNGNKLSMAFFFSLAMASGLGSGEILAVTIPSSIGAKLIPFSLGGIDNVLDIKPLSMYYDRYNPATINVDIVKNSGTRLYVQLLGTSSLTDGVTYIGRYEVTFLLSDNLAA